MFPPRFDYRRATSVEEAIDLLDEHDDARVLAGGHALVPALKNGDPDAQPGLLVDIGSIDALRSIDVSDDGDATIGALTSYATIVDSESLWDAVPTLAEAASEVGDRQIRNRGTIGGNLAQADPDGDLPAAALATDATIVVRGPDGEREIDAGAFFHGANETAVRDDELITAVRLPNGETRGGAYVRKTHPASGYAMIGVAAVVETEGGRAIDDTDDATDSVDAADVTDARIAVTGVTDHAIRLPSVEDALADGDPIDAAADRTDADLADAELRSDVQASGEFRAHLLPTYVERALDRAVGRAVEQPTGGEPA